MYGPVRTVVWEDGGREAPSYPIEGVFGVGSLTAQPPIPAHGLPTKRSR